MQCRRSSRNTDEKGPTRAKSKLTHYPGGLRLVALVVFS
jgi:hypothetical protein